MSPKTHVIPCNISLPPFRSCSLVGYKLTLASALSGHLGRCFPALSPSLPGGWDGSTFQTLKPVIHMGSSWSVGGVEDPLKSGEPKVRKPQKPLFVRSWLWLYVNFESSTQKETQSIGVIIRGGMERKGVWNHNPAIQIRTPMFLDILRLCCTLSNHFCISQFDGFFSQKWRRRDM